MAFPTIPKHKKLSDIKRTLAADQAVCDAAVLASTGTCLVSGTAVTSLQGQLILTYVNELLSKTNRLR